MKKVSCLIVAITIALAGNAQSKKADSLRLLLTRKKTDTGRIEIMWKQGDVYRQNRNDSALSYYRDALQLSEKIGNVKYQIESRSAMANYLYEVKADYVTSLDLYLQNIRNEQETGDTSHIIWDTRGALFVYENAGDFLKTLEYANRLESMVNSPMFKGNPQLPDYKVLADFRLGVAYMELKKQDTAKKYCLRVYNWGIANKELTWTALGSAALGEIYGELKQTDSALYYFRACMPAARQIKRPDIYDNSLIGLANLYWKNKRADSAFFYAVKSYQLAEENHSRNIIDAASLLSEIYYAKKQPDSAYAYLKRSLKLRDSLLSEDKISRVQSLSTKETLQNMEDEQTKKEAVREYQSRIKIYSLLAGLAILVVFMFILYRNNAQRKAANKKIGKAYNDLKSTQAQLIQSEKMASLGELTAGIAHEIQNPLNFVNNFSEVNTELIGEMKQEIDKGDLEEIKAIAMDIEENSKKINQHGKRADAIVKGMLQHSQSGSDIKEPIYINKLADDYLNLAYNNFKAKNKDFEAKLIKHFDIGTPQIMVVPQDIGRVMLNLFNNAFYAVSQKRKTAAAGYKPEVSVTTSTQNGQVTITVKDNGVGIPDAIKEKIMQPFFTTKPTGEGTGLGLSLTYDMVVKGHGGSIQVGSVEGDGSEFIIKLPVG